MAFWRVKKEVQEDHKGPDRRSKESSETFRVGRTLAGDAQKTREDKMQRAADRKKRDAKNIATVVGVVLIILVLLITAVNYVSGVIKEREEAAKPAPVLEPTVAILDENAGENVSQRVKDFVARLEDDSKELGIEIDRVVLPYQMVREVDVYVKGRSEYYKMSLDRSSSVQAEDMSRMIRYLTEKEISPGYVDLRVEGKAYYK